ncbi:hypothetical protein HDR62_05120 [bacterium]|nr:hypothetical protein [bacterium]
MKKRWMTLAALALSLFPLQAQESESTAPRILEFGCQHSEDVTALDVSGCTALTELSCSGSSALASLDVSGCTALRTLYCNSTALISLDVRGCTALNYLSCTFNSVLTSLNMSGCAALTFLDCRGNPLTSWDASGCTGLTSLTCSGFGLKELNVSGCTALTNLECSNNQLTHLDVSGLTALANLECSNNPLARLDVSGCTALKSLKGPSRSSSSSSLYYPLMVDTLALHGVSMDTLQISTIIIGFVDAQECTSLRSLSVSPNLYNYRPSRINLQGCTNLESLRCSGSSSSKGSLDSLNVSGCTSLMYLDCSFNDLISLDVSGCTSLTSLHCSRNQLTSLDVSGCTSLKNLDCSSNQLTNLDVSGCTALTNLDCVGNDLMSLDVSGCKNLKELTGWGLSWSSRPLAVDTLKIYGASMDTLSIKYGSIKVMDASGCTTLKQLDCHSSSLTSLDVSGCTALANLECYDNPLDRLDVSGCTALKSLAGYSADKKLTVDTLKIYGVSMDTLNIGDSSTIGFVDARGCTSLRAFDCRYRGVQQMDLSGCIALMDLVCYGNKLTRLDVSGCTKLKTLHGVQIGSYYEGYTYHYVLVDTLKIYGASMDTLTMYCGSIKVIDASGCTTLKRLDCSNIGLTRLSVRGCTALTDLYCSGNQLTRLDMSDCKALERLSCYDNKLISLDVSKNTLLTYLHCSNNDLTSLDVNGYTALVNLYCSDNQLTNLDVSGCTALEILSCFDNKLTSIDVSGCTNLKKLNGGYHDYDKLTVDTLKIHGVSMDTLVIGSYNTYNSIKVIDASGCTTLKQLECSNIGLTSLDVSGCTSLESLDCSKNQLRTLDVSGSPALTSLDCAENRIPLSVLYEAYNQLSSPATFWAQNQSDSITLLKEEPFDLSSERMVGQELSTFKASDSYYWTENGFVFRFYVPLAYKLILQNTFAGDRYPITFTWYISVVEEMPEGYYKVKVASNNTEWGTASITGNGTYKEGSKVTVTAKPQGDYRFVNWTKADGAVFSTEATYTFVVTEDLELTAYFEKIPDGVGNEALGQDNFRVYAQDRVIYLSADRGRVEVYNALGQCVYSGHATAIPVRNGGLYIVRVGRNSYKVMVR